MVSFRFRPFLLIALVLLVPIVPFVLFHQTVDRWVTQFVEHPPAAWIVVTVVIGLLSTDVLLPVPSSLVSTLAGSQLGPFLATLASWVGLNLGAVVGFLMGRRLGRPLAVRLSSVGDLNYIDRMSGRYGAVVLVLTRALPILAEATVLMTGVNRMSWREFLPPVLLSNLGIALAYSLLGHLAADNEWMVVAASVSISLPLLLSLFLRRRLSKLP
ncbi:MAG: VTT domain-containing protein [Planctomycetaceae bacterium]|nr:VTT domain-containing protein [Planctomycetaceae bacterium]